MKKVFLIGHSYPGIGGIERSFEILLKYLAKYDCDTKVIAAKSKSIEDKDTIYFKKNIFHKLFLLEPFITLMAFKKFFNKNSIILNNSILVVRHLPISYFLSTIGKHHIFIPPCVSNDFFDGVIHNIMQEKGYKKYIKFIKWNITKKIYNFFERKVLKDKVTNVWTFSKNVKMNLLKYHKTFKTINVQPPGIDSNNFFYQEEDEINSIRKKIGIEKSDFVVIYVGRLSAGKNVGLLIEAFKELDITNKKLLLVGSGHYSFEDDCDILYLGKKSLDKLHNYYNCSNLLILPTTNEGFGQVLIESLGCGTPVGGFDSSNNAIDEVISCNLFGKASKKLDKEGLKEVIYSIYQNRLYYENSREEISKEAQNIFSWDKFIKKVIFEDFNK